jgi:hypothetical protein
MSIYLWIGLLVGVGVLLGSFRFVLQRWAATAAGPEPPGWAGSTAAMEWDEKAQDARDDFGLVSVRQVAKGWAASITALLGVFTAVAFIKGPSALTDVGGWEAVVAALLILMAAGVAMVAILLATLAEQGIPGWTNACHNRNGHKLVDGTIGVEASPARNRHHGVGCYMWGASKGWGWRWLKERRQGHTHRGREANHIGH